MKRLYGPMRLGLRLAARDLRHRPGTGLLLLVALIAATTTMTLAMAVRGSAESPWDETFAATAGPHVVATTFRADGETDRVMAAMAADPAVTAHSGPFPLLAMPEGSLRANGRSIGLDVVARDAEPAAVDRPAVTAGGWVRDGGVVVEESFADLLHVRVGDSLTIAGQPFTVAGTAVTAARQPVPFANPGQVWATRADTEKLSPAAELRGKVLMLRLSDPARAPEFAVAHGTLQQVVVEDWQSTRVDALTGVLFALFGLILGASLLAMVAAASVTVAVAGRMASQSRRAALLKAVGATPRFVAAFMFAEYLVFALAAGAAGLLAGSLLAPVIAKPVPGILGTAPVPRPTAATVALVLGAAVALVALSTLVPSIRAARASTVRSLSGPARPPRRSRLAVAVSSRLPVPLLLGMRLVARRPGRAIVSTAGLAVTVAAIVAALWMEAGISTDRSQVAEALGEHSIIYDKLRLVTYSFAAVLVTLALINAILVAWTNALDNARNSALARALGATPGQVTGGLVAAGLLPALAAVALGIPAGFAAFTIAAGAAGGAQGNPTPAAAGLLALLPATLVLTAILTTIPSHLAGRRPAIEALRTD
ncbi:MAG TPA: FtsX-like permease family protein [Candidatus Limnocylindrales bacterium]